jgi:hypothetical protein
MQRNVSDRSVSHVHLRALYHLQQRFSQTVSFTVSVFSVFIRFRNYISTDFITTAKKCSPPSLHVAKFWSW